MKNEIMKMLKESGAIDKFVKSNNRAIRHTREMTGDKKWKPAEAASEIAAMLALTVELNRNEELENRFEEFAHEIAMNEIAKALVKIANDNMEVE